jgi:predicted DNA-binding transcriptional regulator
MFNPDGKNMSIENEIIEKLILQGGLQVAGVDQDGQLLYQFTPKMQKINEELYKDHLNFVNSEVMKLWEQGFVNIDLLQKEPIVTLTPKAFVPDELAKLSKQQNWSLEEIKRLLKNSKI